MIVKCNDCQKEFQTNSKKEIYRCIGCGIRYRHKIDPEYKKKLSKISAAKRFTEDQKHNISVAIKKLWKNEEYKKKNVGSHRSSEYVVMASNKSKETWQNKERRLA